MGLSLRKLGSKIFDQINPFDNGRTYQQRTPTNNRSVVQQAVNSGASNVAQGVARNAVRVAGQTPVGRVVAPVVAPISSPQDFIDNVSVPVERAVTKSPVGRGLQGVGLGALRVGAGYAQAAGGAYDLATPGLGKNRLSKSATALGKQTDDTLKEVGGNQAIYKGAQLGSEVALLYLLKGAGSLGKVGIKGLSQIPKVASGASAVSKGVKVATSPVTKAINPATAKVSQGITKVGTKGLGGKITAKAATNIVSPKYQGVNAAFSGIQLSKEAAQGRAITPERIATDLAIGGVAFPVAGAVGSQALLPGAKIALKGVGKGAKVSAKATQDAIQAVRNPLKPLNEAGYIRVPNNASDELVKNVYRNGTDANTLYHGTKYDNALEILKTGKIKASKPNANRDLIPDNPNAQVSLSRQRNSGFYNSASADVKFVVDKSKVGKTRQYVDGELSPSDYKNPRVFEAEEQTKKDIPLTNIKRIEGGALLEPADEKALRALATKQGIPFVAFDDVKGMRNVLPTQPTKNKLGLKKLNETGAVGKDVTQYNKSFNVNDKDDAEYLARIVGEDKVKQFQSGDFSHFRGGDKGYYESIVKGNLTSETPKTTAQKLEGRVKPYGLGSSKVYHVTSADNTQSILNNGFKKGSELPESAYRGGGYGQMQDSISFATKAEGVDRFATKGRGVLLESELKPNSKVVEVKGVEYAEDLNDFVPELRKQGVDAVHIGGGENEVVVINPKSIKGINRHKEFDPRKAKDDLSEFYNQPTKNKLDLIKLNEGGFVANPFNKDGSLRSGVKKDQIFDGVDGKPRVEFNDSGAKTNTNNLDALNRPNELAFSRQALNMGVIMKTVDEPTAIKRLGEIDKLISSAKKEATKAKKTTLSNVLEHPELYKQYPELQNMPVEFVKNRNNGLLAGYDPAKDRILINANKVHVGDNYKKSLLHEIQHAIQEREGFAAGGDVRWKDYNNLAGEAEARAVAERINMTPAERAKIPFNNSLDVPKEDLIMRNSDGTAMSIDKTTKPAQSKVPKASQLPKVALKQETAPQAPVPENNLVDSLPNNNIADNTKVPLQVTNKDTLLGELKTAMVDKDAPILDYLKGVEKETGQTGLVKQFMYDTGLQRRSSSIANAMMDNSDNLSAAFRGLVGKEKKAFDGYVGARREIQYAKDGLQTSAPVEELQGVVSAGSRFDDRYNALNGYYKEWAGRLHQAGILDDATYKSFTDSGEYTRVQRVMDDLAGFRGSGGNSYSLGTTMTKQKRKGSQRDIQPADLTAMKYAQDSQTEIQRNQTSSNLIDVLASQGHARQVENTTSKNTLSRIVDGKTEIWEVPRDIKEVADNVSPYQLGILSRIIAFPQRLLRAGATGLSAPFTTANYAKDQVSSAAMSENVKVTHQPKNVFNGLYQAAKDFGVGTDDPTWQKFLENLGDTTQYDFLRNQKSAKQFSRELRLGQGGRAINKGLHPIRTVEDLVQITEKATRFQNFKGTYEKALADGVPEAEALQKATLAAWQNSVDFSRMGSVGQVANLLIPYFNAGIQGTRLLVRRTGEAPLATSSKIISFVGLPLAAATFYNMEDEGRKKVYDNISDFEKQNNIIIVLPGAEQHEDGSYSGVVKIPLQPGMSNTVQPLRMAIENYAHDNPQDVLAMSKQFLGAVAGPINTNSISSAVGGLIPQVAKPMVQQVANNDFFTQKQIVPDFIQKATDANGNPVKETDKAYPYTSGTARIIGNATGQSPIRVEKFIKDTSAKVGQYTMNATDNALAKAGIIPDEQIGGISVKEDFARRFAVAQGKENTKKSEGARHYDDVNKETATLNGNELAAFNALHPNKKNFLGDTITDMDSVYNSAARLDAYNRYPKVFEVDKRLDAKGRKAGNPGNPLYDLEQWQVKKVLEKENLPPGASDKELSKLHEQDWYNDYSTKKSKFFTDIKNKSASDLETAKAKGDTKKVKALEASITKFNSSDNPYPVTSPDLQKQMDYYSSLPKGTGARKSWIQSNPGLYKQMQDQYAKIDNWQNVQRGKRGLDTTEGVAGANAGYDTGSSSGGYSKGGSKGGGSGGGGSSSPEVESAYKYAIKLKSSGGIPKPKVKAVASKKVKASGKVGKIKVSSKKSLV